MIDRLANAFCYYGVVLMTTELFEAGDECHGLCVLVLTKT